LLRNRNSGLDIGHTALAPSVDHLNKKKENEKRKRKTKNDNQKKRCLVAPGTALQTHT